MKPPLACCLLVISSATFLRGTQLLPAALLRHACMMPLPPPCNAIFLNNIKNVRASTCSDHGHGSACNNPFTSCANPHSSSIAAFWIRCFGRRLAFTVLVLHFFSGCTQITAPCHSEVMRPAWQTIVSFVGFNLLAAVGRTSMIISHTIFMPWANWCLRLHEPVSFAIVYQQGTLIA